MRRIVAADSFNQEVEAIGAAVEQRFGEDARDTLVADLTRLCDVVAYFPIWVIVVTATIPSSPG